MILLIWIETLSDIFTGRATMLTKPDNRIDQENLIKCYISEQRNNQILSKSLPVNMLPPLVKLKVTSSAVFPLPHHCLAFFLQQARLIEKYKCSRCKSFSSSLKKTLLLSLLYSIIVYVCVCVCRQWQEIVLQQKKEMCANLFKVAGIS